MTTERDSIPWREIPRMREISEKMTLGSLMRSYRICEAWNQQVVADKLGVSKQMVSQYESGKRTPSLAEAVRIAHALDMPVVSCVRLCLKAQLERAGLTEQMDLQVTLKAAG